MRITLDYNIIYKLHNSKIIKKDEEIVAELKTSINKNLDDLFEMYPFQEIRFSKYCNGIKLFTMNNMNVALVGSNFALRGYLPAIKNIKNLKLKILCIVIYLNHIKYIIIIKKLNLNIIGKKSLEVILT